MKLLILFCSLLYLVHCGIIGIDFGSQYIKIAYQPYNKPPDIVVDPNGKRKIENSVFFGDDMRSFGSNAVSLSNAKPEFGYSSTNALLGAGAETDKISAFQHHGYPYEFILTDRNTWALKLRPESGFSDITDVTVEELNAMILDYVISVVEKEYGDIRREVVISVPSSFTQQQRQALLDAAELADIKVLSMVDQTTAAAVTYAMTRAEEGVKRLLVYDMGSKYTEVSAVEIETVKEGKGYHRNVVILGKEATEIGGDDFSNVVSTMITEQFQELYKEDPRIDPHANHRIHQDSQKYKEILSANREVEVVENSLYHGRDLVFTLTRESFEDESSDLVSRAIQVMKDLLEKLDMTVNEFSEVQLVGGSTRIPIIRKRIEEAVNGVPVYTNLNGDDSAALGCIYYGSGKLFPKNRLENVYDTLDIPVYVKIERRDVPHIRLDDLNEDYIAANNGEIASFPIFSGDSGYERERTFSFPIRDSFSILLQYHKEGFMQHKSNLISPIKEYSIRNISTILDTIENRIQSNISITFILNAYGLVQLKEAVLVTRYIDHEDRLAYERRRYNPFYRSSGVDPRLVTRGRVRNDEVVVDEVVDHLKLLPMSLKDKRESRRKLKQMRYRDDSTRRFHKEINSIEGRIIDIELAIEEDTFIESHSKEDINAISDGIERAKELIAECQKRRELLYKKEIIDLLSDLESRVESLSEEEL